MKDTAYLSMYVLIGTVMTCGCSQVTSPCEKTETHIGESDFCVTYLKDQDESLVVRSISTGTSTFLRQYDAKKQSGIAVMVLRQGSDEKLIEALDTNGQGAIDSLTYRAIIDGKTYEVYERNGVPYMRTDVSDTDRSEHSNSLWCNGAWQSPKECSSPQYVAPTSLPMSVPASGG